MRKKFLYGVGDYVKTLNFFNDRDVAQEFYKNMIKRLGNDEFKKVESIAIARFRFDKIIKLWKRKKK